MIKERILTVAVLPFVNVSADPLVDEIGAALADALRASLDDAEVLCVSCESRNAIGDDDFHVSALGRTMHADLLLFGCVCETDGTLRAQVQVVDAMSGQARWSAQVEARARQTTADYLAEQIGARLERAIRSEF